MSCIFRSCIFSAPKQKVEAVYATFDQLIHSALLKCLSLNQVLLQVSHSELTLSIYLQRRLV